MKIPVFNATLFRGDYLSAYHINRRLFKSVSKIAIHKRMKDSQVFVCMKDATASSPGATHRP
jgi:hypothetical protein